MTIACLQARLLERSELARRVNKLSAQLDEIRALHMAARGVPLNDAEAEALLHQMYKDELYTKRIRLLGNTQAQIRILDTLDKLAAPETKNAGNALKVGEAMMEFDPRMPAGVPNIRSAIEYTKGIAFGYMGSFMEKFRPRKAGLVLDERGIDDIVANLGWGKAVGADEAHVAQGVRSTFDWLLKEFNRLGGAQVKVDNFFPNVHDRVKISKASDADWLDVAVRHFDLENMRDYETGRSLSMLNVEKRNSILLEARQSLVNRGYNKMLPGQAHPFGGSESFIGKRMNERFIKFKSYEDWKAYHDEFGNGTPLNAIIDFVEGMSRDIGLMRILGPDPYAAMAFMESRITRQLQEIPGANSTNVHSRLYSLFEHVAGLNDNVGESGLAVFGASTRKVLASAHLGSAIFSALGGDFATTIAAASVDKLPVQGIMTRYLSLLADTEGAQAQRRLAQRMGLIVQLWNSNVRGNTRLWMEGGGAVWAERASDIVMRGSLMARHTDNLRLAVEMELNGFLVERRGKGFAQLEPEVQALLRRHGFESGEWDKLRNSPTIKDDMDGNEWYSLATLNEHNSDVAQRLGKMFTDETDYFVLRSLSRTQRWVVGREAADTIPGQLWRSVAFIKGFPLAAGYVLYGRAMQLERGMSRFRYLANLAIFGTVLGMTAEQASLIAQGKKPVTPDNTAEWRQLAVKGLYRAGVFGLLGDALMADTSTLSGGLQSMMLGPIVGTDFVSAAKFGKTSIAAALGDQKANPGRDFVKAFSSMMPGSTLWYTRLAMDRLVFDEMQRMLDRDPYKSFSSQEKFAQKFQNTEFYDGARPGKALGLR